MNRLLSVDEIKYRFTIPEAWRALGYPEPRKWAECLSPWRDERRPSFSIFNKGRAFNDFSTGEGGDVIRFWSLARGISDAQSISEIKKHLGGLFTEYQATSPPPTRSATPKPQEPKKVILPADINYTGEQVKAYLQSRRIDPIVADAINEIEKGTDPLSFTVLRQGTHRGHLSLIAIERRGDIVNTSCRRLDGKPYPAGDKGIKEICVKDSTRSLPLGLSLLEIFPHASIMLLEGTPDWLASWHYVLRARKKGQALPAIPIALLGASNSIHPEALHLMKGRRVKIFPHLDDRGQGTDAGQKWADQLFPYTKSITGYNFTGGIREGGQPVTDLNDTLFMKPQEQPTPSQILT